MRIIANESHIETRTKIGERAPLVGLVILAISTILIFFRPGWWFVTLILVWVGFIASIAGSYLGERYIGLTAHHRRVPELLKGLGDEYVLLEYVTPVPFVLVDPGGLTVITVKSQGGEIGYRRGAWYHHETKSFLRRLAGQEGIGKPHKLAVSEAADLEQYLEKRLLGDVDVPVRPVVLFIHPDVRLEAEDSPISTFYGKDLKRWLRKEGHRSPLPEDVRAQLYAALEIEDERSKG